MPDDLPLFGRFHASSHVRPAVDLHQAVGTISRDTKESAWAVVLEAAAEDSNAGGIQSGGNRLSAQGGNSFAIENEA
jgi:hypothetical protein